MAGLADTFRRRARLTIQERLSPAQLGAVVGQVARARHQELIAQGRVSQSFLVYVDGILGASEDRIDLTRTGGGRIRYVGVDFAEAVLFIFTMVRALSPVLSGRFKAAWLIVVDGIPWQRPIEQISPEAREILITNFAPYARRLEQSVGRTRPEYHITEAASQAGARRYPGLKIRRKFVSIPSGIAVNGRWQIPYHRKTPPREMILYPAVQILLKGV